MKLTEPCDVCGKMHDDPDYGHYDWAHCHCEHGPWWRDDDEPDRVMCCSCGFVAAYKDGMEIDTRKEPQ